MKLLLHCCCGPCALVTADHFRSSNTAVVGWFYNPNVHPVEEHARRAATMAAAANSANLAMLPDGPAMTLADFLLALARVSGPRCSGCYLLRLRATARKAAEQGFDAFSSTLLISPYQDLAAIAEVGKEAAGAAGVEFRFADLRDEYRESCGRARDLALYRQSYCGCLFSALERAARRVRRAVNRACAAPTG